MEGYAFWAVALLLAGLCVLVLEIFVPSGGILAATMLSLVASSLFCAYQAWGTSAPWAFRTFLGAVLILVPTVLVAAFRILPHTSMGKRLLLQPRPLEELAQPDTPDKKQLPNWVHQIGKTATALVPSGVVVIQGNRLPATSQGQFIDRDEFVEIVAVQGAKLVVRPAKLSELKLSEAPAAPMKPTDANPASSANPPAKDVSHAGSELPRPIDFDVPT